MEVVLVGGTGQQIGGRRIQIPLEALLFLGYLGLPIGATFE
jgi:hypothetical protein